MNLNFEFLIFYALVISGVVVLFDLLFLARKRAKANFSVKKMPPIVDYSRSFFPVLLVVFSLRSFLFEPFRVPSGSLEPTLFVGDFILTNKFSYGLRLPFLHKTIVPLGTVNHGDIVVFHYPPDPSIYYIKRVIGLPGDHLSYINKILYVNGTPAPQTFEKNTLDYDNYGFSWDVVQKQENFLGIQHGIYQIPTKPAEDFKDLVVPPGKYFMMGDNRDDSSDSRAWGFVPDENIVGKATLIWLSWDSRANWSHKIRWNRIGTRIH